MQLEKMDAFFEARLADYEEHMLQNIDGAEAFYAVTAELLPQMPGVSTGRSKRMRPRCSAPTLPAAIFR